MGVREETLGPAGLGETLMAELSALRKAFYASAGLGFGCVEYIVSVYLMKFYTDHALLDPGWTGAALMLGKLLDGVSDPVMGYISDRTKSRWGRRRPWFLAGAIPLVLSFIAMFMPPAGLAQWQLFLWLTVANTFFFVGTTMVEVPHAAFGSEVTRTHQQRVSIMGWRQGFSTTGLFIGAVAPGFFLRVAENRAETAALAEGLGEELARQAGHAAAGGAHSTMALVFGVIVFVAFTATFLGTRELSGPRTPPRDTIFGDFTDALKSRAFRWLMFAMFFSEIAGALTATLVLYAIGDWWGFHGHEEPMIATYLLTGIFSIAVWMRIGRHFEKHHLFGIGAFMGTLGLCGMLLCPYIGPWWGYFMLIVAGLGFGARSIMIMALLPDIVDDDEVRTHTRKDGAYFGMWSLLRKITRSVALAMCGIGLRFFGYQTGALEQPDSAVRGIAVMYAVIPAIVLVLCGGIMFFFPLDRAHHDTMLTELDSRRNRTEAT